MLLWGVPSILFEPNWWDNENTIFFSQTVRMQGRERVCSQQARLNKGFQLSRMSSIGCTWPTTIDCFCPSIAYENAGLRTVYSFKGAQIMFNTSRIQGRLKDVGGPVLSVSCGRTHKGNMMCPSWKTRGGGAPNPTRYFPSMVSLETGELLGDHTVVDIELCQPFRYGDEYAIATVSCVVTIMLLISW